MEGQGKRGGAGVCYGVAGQVEPLQLGVRLHVLCDDDGLDVVVLLRVPLELILIRRSDTVSSPPPRRMVLSSAFAHSNGAIFRAWAAVMSSLLRSISDAVLSSDSSIGSTTSSSASLTASSPISDWPASSSSSP